MSDDTTLTTDVTTPDAGGAPDDTNKKDSAAYVPSHRLKEEADKRRALEQEAEQLRQQLKEKEWYVSPLEVAKAKYGAEVVESDAVKATLEKYPNMAIEDAIKLAGVDTGGQQPAAPVASGGIPFSPRPAQPEPPKEMTMDELKASLAEKFASWELKL